MSNTNTHGTGIASGLTDIVQACPPLPPPTNKSLLLFTVEAAQGPERRAKVVVGKVKVAQASQSPQRPCLAATAVAAA